MEILIAGMKKLISLSEGVRESLRRLSSVTWMAEELLKVAAYFQPNKWVSLAQNPTNFHIKRTSHH